MEEKNKNLEQESYILHLEDYRDILKQNPTPLEAYYLSEYKKEKLDNLYIQKNMTTATILSLCQKKKIELKMDERSKVKIVFRSNDIFDLDEGEVEIYEFLKEISGKTNEVEIEKLREVSENNPLFYVESINRFIDEIIEDLYKRKLIDKNKEKKYKRYSKAYEKCAIIKYIYGLIVMSYIMTYILGLKTAIAQTFGEKTQMTIGIIVLMIFPVVLVCIHLFKSKFLARDKIEVLTNKGKKEKEKWKNLKRYIENDSLLSEKDMTDFHICENYLIYATAFGISDKAINKFEMYYSKMIGEEKWNNEMKEKYPLIYSLCNPIYKQLWENDNSINIISVISKEVYKSYCTAARKCYKYLYRSNIKYAKELIIESDDWTNSDDKRDS